jgi:hypothetical protein
MSTASIINLPIIFQSNLTVTTAIVSGVPFDYTLSNNFQIPKGNYLIWTYLTITGDTDTILGTVATVIDIGGSITGFTSSTNNVTINDGIVRYQNCQINTVETLTNFTLNGIIGYNNTPPNITGTIIFYPL